MVEAAGILLAVYNGAQRSGTGATVNYARKSREIIVIDPVTLDLKRRGMKFVGSTVIYSYLQAIGVINGHGPECDFYEERGRLAGKSN